jgi:hypothetical protein
MLAVGGVDLAPAGEVRLGLLARLLLLVLEELEYSGSSRSK